MISLRRLVELAPVGSKLDDAIVEADAWFDLCADLPSFITRSVLRSLLSRGWDDEQRVPQSEVDGYEKNVLPHLLSVIDGGTPDKLLVALRDFSIVPPFIAVP